MKSGQEGAQTAAARIEEVLQAHRPYGLDCKCGTAINSDAWWAAHATAALVEALGLTPEWTVESKWGVEDHNISDFYATPAGIAEWRNQQDIPTKVVQRFVTKWEAL
jgi:hypothetical protein